MLSAICISLHAFWRGAWGLPLEDEWECPILPKRVSHLVQKKGCWAKQGNGPEEEPIWVVSQTILGKFQGFHYRLMIVTTHAVGFLNSVQVHFCFQGYTQYKCSFKGH